MTIFDHLKDVLFTKRGELLHNVDDETTFNAYMINRWCSMHSPRMAILINSTCNWLYNVFETKQQYYKFVLSVLPKVPFKRIHYIKKQKNDNQEKKDDNNIQLIAKRLELSQREIKSYYEFQSCCTKRASESER